MKKIILASIFVFTCLPSFARPGSDIVDKVDSCYEREAGASASYCADMALARNQKRLQRLIRVGDDDNNQNENKGIFVTYQCSDDGDPVFQRVVLSKTGKEISTTNLETFTVGDDYEERTACRKRLKAATFEIASGEYKIECNCVGNDPVLKLSIADYRYQEIASVNLDIFKEGDDPQERAECNRMKKELPVCK